MERFLSAQRDIYYSGLNFSSREWIDPFFSALLQVFSASFSADFYLVYELLIFTLGMLVLARFLGAGLLEGFLSALYLIGLQLVVLGFDPFLLKSHWFPMLLATYLITISRRTWFATILVLLSTVLWIFSSGSIAMFGLVLAFLLVRFGYPLLLKDEELILKNIRLLDACFFAAVLGAYFFLPVYPMPEYPAGAQLVPLSPLALQSFPYLGPYLKPNPILTEVFNSELLAYSKGFFVFFCLTTFVFVVSFFLCSKEERSFSRGTAAVIIYGSLFLLLFFEARQTDFSAIYLPHQILMRLVPGLAISQIPWVLVPTVSVAGYIFLLKLIGVRTVAALAVFSGVLLEAEAFDLLKLGGELGKPVLVSDKVVGAEKIRYSPSGFLVSQEGDWVLNAGEAGRRSFNNMVRSDNRELNRIAVGASMLPEEAKFAVDGLGHTRWRTGRPQKVGDIFQFSLAKPVDVRRVVLSVHKSPTDFPRGLRVEISEDGKNYKTVYERQDWFGPVKWSKDGYPYYGPQSEVVVDFPKSEHGRFFRFIQIASDPHYDWSIGEIKLYH